MGKLLNRLPPSSKPMVVVAMLIVAALTASPHRIMAAEVTEEVVAQMECLSVPATVFADTLRSTLDGVFKVASLVAKFAGMFETDFRVSNAINDCLDLLDLSSQELGLSLYASQNGKGNGTGDLGSDLKTWLSAAFGNQDTCLDGFEGTNSMVKTLVAGSINEISSLVRQILHMVHYPTRRPIRASNKGRANKGGRPVGGGRRLLSTDTDADGFPSWISHKDRKLLQTGSSLTPDVVVAQDGTGNFTQIMDAVHAAPNHNTDRFVIYIKKGVYEENVEIKRKKTNIMMYGDGMDVTIITSNRNFIDGWTTYRSATFGVSGAGFIARDLTIQNTAGPEKHQAVAFRSDSDLSAIYRCAFRGYQDTLYAHSSRQFYRECTITGTVDFIFGDAIAVLQNCQILARKGLPNQKNTITAQGRKDPGENTGFSIQFCNISGDSSLLPTASVNGSLAGNTTTNATKTYTYLGRPWKAYSRTVIMESYISDLVRPEGWLEWNGDLYLDSLYYAEYMNSGPGASLESRVKWPGYHMFNSSTQATNYTVAQFLGGDLWLPSTGVKFISGLSNV